MIKPIQQIAGPATQSRDNRRKASSAGRGATSRTIVVSDGRAQPGIRDALFVHMGPGNVLAGGSAGFVAQHLDQEWVHGKPYIDPRRGIQAYRRARNIQPQRLDLLPPL